LNREQSLATPASVRAATKRESPMEEVANPSLNKAMRLAVELFAGGSMQKYNKAATFMMVKKKKTEAYEIGAPCGS